MTLRFTTITPWPIATSCLHRRATMSDLECRLIDGAPADGERGGGSPRRDEESESDVDAADAPATALSSADAAALTAKLARDADPLAERRKGARTGPKGVRADKAWADSQAVKADHRAALQAADAHRTAGYGAALPAGTTSVSLAAQLAERGRILVQRDGAPAPDDEEGEAAENNGGDSESEDSDAFVASFRAARLAQLRAHAAGPQWGEVEEITERFAFADVVDATDPRSFAVVLLYEDFIPEAATLRADVLPAAAEMFPRARFLAARSAVVSDSFDAIALPALLVYRARALVCSILRVHEEGEEEEGAGGPGGAAHGGSRRGLFPAAALAAVLLRHGVDIR